MAILDNSDFANGNRIPMDALQVDAIDTERLERYRRMWSFYRGKHWSFDRSKDEPVVTFNLCRPLIDLLVTFLFKDGFSITIPDDPTTEGNEQEERQFVKAALDSAWTRRNVAAWAYNCGQMGSVTGDVFIRVSIEKDKDEGTEHPRPDVIPSHFCFPTLDPEDNTKLTAMRVSWPVWESKEITEGLLFRRVQKRKQMRIMSEIWTEKETWRLLDKEEVEGSRQPNRLGEIPFVHISNFTLGGDFYGVSDLADVVEMNRELNEKLTDISDVINYHGSPLTVVTGARLGQLERGPNRMWALPDSATITNLKLDGDLKATVDYIEMLRKMVFEVSSVPESALGRSGAAGATGAGQAMIYMPLLQRRAIKVALYGEGLQKVNRLMLKYIEIIDPAFKSQMAKLKNRYRTKITFSDPLPRDEGVELGNAEKRLSIGLSSREDELKKGGHGEKSISETLSRADADRKRLFQQELEDAQVPAKPRTGKGRGSVRPNRDSQGQKISDNATK